MHLNPELLKPSEATPAHLYSRFLFARTRLIWRTFWWQGGIFMGLQRGMMPVDCTIRFERPCWPYWSWRTPRVQHYTCLAPGPVLITRSNCHTCLFSCNMWFAIAYAGPYRREILITCTWWHVSISYQLMFVQLTRGVVRSCTCHIEFIVVPLTGVAGIILTRR